MHRELRQTDIDGVQRNVRVRDVAKRGAACHIRTVRELLEGNIRPAAEHFKERCADRIGRIFLVCIVFYNNSAVHNRAVNRICFAGIIRMDRVRVVRGDHKAGRDRAEKLLRAAAKYFVDSSQNIFQKRAVRALFCAAPDFFIIENRKNRKCSLRSPAALFGGIPGRNKALQRRVYALQIIEMPGRKILMISAEYGASAPCVEEKIIAENSFLFNPGRLRHNFHKVPCACLVAKQRHDLVLYIECVPAVCFPVHMNRQRRQHQKISVHIDKPCGKAAVFILHNESAGNGERSVKPGSNQHSAVFLDVELDIRPRLHLGICLDFKRRRVAVRSCDHEMRVVFLRNPERDDRRFVPYGKIAPAPAQLPLL